MTDQQPTATGKTDPAADARDNRDIAAISYVWILSVVVYFSKRESAFVRFHARQGMVLFGLSIILWLIPIVGQFLELVVLALAVLGFLAAAQGQWKELPLIGAVARRDIRGVRSSWRGLLDNLLHGWKAVKKDVMKQAPPDTSPVAPQPPTPVDSSGSVPPPQP